MNSPKPIAIKAATICCQGPEVLANFDLDSHLPDKALLPAGLRRRAGLTTLMAVTAATRACEIAGVETNNTASVFASVGGEIQVTDSLCRSLTEPGYLLSPTQFHNSVHNTTAGYWGILTQCQQPATAIAAVDDTLAMGILEAWSQLQQQSGNLLLVCYDEQWPQYLAPPMGSRALACAMVLSDDIETHCLGLISRPEVLDLALVQDQNLVELCQSAPAATCIPLLQALNKIEYNNYIGLNSLGNTWVTHLQK